MSRGGTVDRRILSGVPEEDETYGRSQGGQEGRERGGCRGQGEMGRVILMGTAREECYHHGANPASKPALC